jgi:hypothetical protein
MNDDIEPLPEVEAERVIDASNAKTFALEDQLVASFDVPGWAFQELAAIPVYNSANKQIGAATTYLVGTRVVADIFIDYNTPERLDIEARNRPMYVSAEFHHEDSTKTACVPHLYIMSTALPGSYPL